MGPAIRAGGIGRFIAAETLRPATRIQPHGVPSTSRSVIENYWVAESIGEWALTARIGETGKRITTVGGYRCARNVDRADVAASRIIVSDNYLVGIIRIAGSECLRLRNIRR